MLRGDAAAAVRRLAQTRRTDVAISIITAMELRFGLAKKPSRKTHHAVTRFLDTVEISMLPEAIDTVYGTLRADLERRGCPIGPLDTIIAAHAVALDAVLITNNLREFSRVAGLRCENWAEER